MCAAVVTPSGIAHFIHSNGNTIKQCSDMHLVDEILNNEQQL